MKSVSTHREGYALRRAVIETLPRGAFLRGGISGDFYFILRTSLKHLHLVCETSLL